MELTSFDKEIVAVMLSMFGGCKIAVEVPAAWQSPYVQLSNSKWVVQYVPNHQRIYVRNSVTGNEWSSDGRLDRVNDAVEFLQYAQKEVYGE
jgi:hypothetical protein